MVLTIGGGAARIARPLVSSAPAKAANESRNGYLRPPVVLATIPGISLRQSEEATPKATPKPKAKPTATPTPEPTPEPQPAYVVYTVQPGDTVDSIAVAFGIGPDSILWNNTDIVANPDLLLVGQKLQVPSVNGIIYTVALGDTLTDIAAYYQIDVQSIFAFVPNNIASADHVVEGMVLVLPGGVPPPPPIPEAIEVIEDTAPPPEPGPAPAPAPASSGYIWPWSGAISQYFGGYHKGIDIDGFGHSGAPIVAAASGQVVLASWLDYGYGNYVIIEHADGSRTLYAHLSDIYVAQGQFVAQGEAIGALGCTGYCTGPHLHFEVHIGGGPVDPLAYLP